MLKEEILEILQDWNMWKNDISSGIERKKYIENCIKFLKPNVIISIIGVRRSGKSYIMRQIAKSLLAKGIEKKNILIVNFEDRRFVEFYPKMLDEIYETYLQFLNPEEHFIFLDEIYNVKAWERWVRTMHELGKAKIIISGSSSKLLASELTTVLTGRHLDISVFPLSFQEFLCFRKIEIKDYVEIVAKKTEIKRMFAEYMEFGGFPEIVLSEEKKHLLLAYFDDIITKDIEKRYYIKKGNKLRALARFYLTNISGLISFNSIREFLDITTNTIEKFSSYLEESNLIFFVKRFSFKVKEQEKSPRKIYAIDTGLANAIGFRFKSEYGKVLENIVAIELKRMSSMNLNMEIFYWKNPQHEEVDFIIKEGLQIKQAIQVCWNPSDKKTKNREIRSLLKAMKELSLNNGLVITEDFYATEIIDEKTITFIPVWKWLCETKIP